MDKSEIDRRVKKFVQETLGCGCPEKVFKDIKFIKGHNMSDDFALMNRIEIGGRLLVYIVRDRDFIAVDVDRLMSIAVAIRDGMNFNRVRLVISSNEPERLEKLCRADKWINETMDEKSHLHFIRKDQRPF